MLSQSPKKILLLTLVICSVCFGVRSATTRTTPYTRSLLYPVADANDIRPLLALGAINVKDDPYNASGDGTTDDETAIEAAIATAAVNGGAVYFPSSTGAYKFTTAISVPGNVALHFAPGASLMGDGSATITLAGGFLAAQHQVFQSTMSVASIGRIGLLNVKWWGAKGDGTTDDAAAIQATINAAEIISGAVFMPPGTYKIETGLSIDDPITLVGASRNGVIIKKVGDIVGITINAPGAWDNTEGVVVIRSFTLDSAGGADAKNGILITEFDNAVVDDVAVINQGAHGIEFKKGNSSCFSNLQIFSNTGDGIRVSSSDVNCNACVFSNIDCLGNGGYGFYLLEGNENWCLGITCQSNTAGGVRVDSYGNCLWVYAESNTGSDVELTANAKANIVHSVVPSDVVTNNGYNLVFERTGGTDVMWQQGAYFGLARMQTIDLLTGYSIRNNGPGGARIEFGGGSPESVITAPVGSLFLRTDGGYSTTLYVKESGTGNTGWEAK